MKKWFGNLVKWLAEVGADPKDDAETRLPKSMLVLSATPFLITGFIWGSMYLAFGETLAALIPIGYAIFSLCSIIYYGITRNFPFFLFSQLLLILILPFLLMVALGGFVQGSAVILWGVLCPLGAMLFDDPKKAIRWFYAYLVLLIVSYVLNPILDIKSHLTLRQIHIFFLINVAGVGGLIFLLFNYFVSRKQFFQQRTEELLLNILPKEVATELKETGTTTAKVFEEVTVLFTDFENFTLISEHMNAQDLVNEIHYCYSAFDTIISKHGIEKIKTIGDSYMCVAGLPVKRKTHATDAVAAALEMCAFVESEKQVRSQKGLTFFNVRVGLHSGPVVAGIVGLKKFQYDIWGDTVNIAKRLESGGEVGKVNISGSTFHYIKDRYHCHYRGKMEAKHKGQIDMYFVEAVKNETI